LISKDSVALTFDRVKPKCGNAQPLETITTQRHLRDLENAATSMLKPGSKKTAWAKSDQT
jgi:hypothetical protein